ncbi:MAG: Sir2 family NAD-dependent protein deacetylase [Anaerolineae bacterium]|jgi:NAD-dependent deacetylase
MPDLDHLIARSAQLLREASYAVAMTGAGISTPSGIPDFRSPDSGLWTKVDPFAVASLFAFRLHPQDFYEWIRPLARLIVEARPNPAHQALARLEAAGLVKAIITQNIDGLHQSAGSQRVHEVHGHVREATCVRCYRTVPADSLIEKFVEDGQVPRCTCGGLLKPNVILFGEQLPLQVLTAARKDTNACDLMLVAGSSLEMEPAADLPLVALGHDARLLIVNYQPTYVDDRADVVIHDDVAAILPRIADMALNP